MRTGRWYTLTEAATACSVSRSTVKRYLWAKRFANAVQDDGDELGAWLIPEQDLRAAGWAPDAFLVAVASTEAARAPSTSELAKSLADLQRDVEGLRAHIELSRHAACHENVPTPQAGTQDSALERRLLTAIRATLRETT